MARTREWKDKEVAVMPKDREGQLYSVQEAASALGVSTSTIWRWIETERLPAYRIGPKAVRIRKADLEDAVKPARTNAKEVIAMRSSATTAVDVANKPLTAAEADHMLRAIERAEALREKMLARRKGKPLSSSWDIIDRAREERSRDL